MPVSTSSRARGAGATGAELFGYVLVALLLLGLEAVLDIVALPGDIILVPVEVVGDLALFAGFASALSGRTHRGRQIGGSSR